MTTITEIPNQTRLVPIEGEADACDILVRDDGEIIWRFHCERIVPEYSRLHANVGVDWLPANDERPLSSYELPRAGFRPIHVDWRSGSSIETFERRIRQYFDPAKQHKTIRWTQLVQFAANRLDEFLFQTGDLDVPTPITDHQNLVRDYLIKPLWPTSNRPVIWYGQGEAGKGVLATAAAFSLATGQNLASLQTKHLPRGLVYVDYEDSFDEFNTRLNRYANGLGQAIPLTVRRFDPRGRLFIDIVHQLKGKVDAAGGTDAYIIDSAIPACRGDVIKPEPVGAFFGALSILGKPSIVIAHETKDSPTSWESPFGAQLWRTSAAMTVNFTGSSEPRQDMQGHWVRDVLLRCTKANNVPRFGNLAFQLLFTNDDESASNFDPAATWIKQLNPTQVSADLLGKLSPLQQLVAALFGRQLTIKEIAVDTSLTEKQIASTLDRNQDIFASDGMGGRGRGSAARWRLMNDRPH